MQVAGADSHTSDSPGRSHHRALVYEEPNRFVDGVHPFVAGGVRDGDRVLVAVTGEKRGWLREALGADADAVEFADAEAMYERHGPMLRTVVDYLAHHSDAGHGRVRIVAEQALATRTPAETRAYLRYEAAANVAYRPFAASVLCPYDARRLPDSVIRDALRTHPEVLDGDIATARDRVARLAEAAGMARAKIEELRVAVTEVATNALVHGAARRLLHVYARDGAFVCHVHDGGHGLRDPLAGYVKPDLDAQGGRGLWLAHQLCDIVESAADNTGTHVYLRMTI